MFSIKNIISRRNFLKNAIITAAAPSLLPGCSSASIKKLEKSNPGVTEAQLKMVEFYSNSRYLQPPPSQKLLEFVVHLYTPEEAEVAQYLSMTSGSTAEYIAWKSGKSMEETELILSRLADEKRAILAFKEEDEPREYQLMPLAPGTFEQVLMEGKDDEWHRKYGALFDEIYDTGYIKKIVKHEMQAARYLPVEETVSANPAALPTDLLSEMLDGAKSFALGFCQCGQAHKFAGKGCGRPLETCIVTDSFAEHVISRNIMRRIDRAEAMEIKLKAMKAGLVTMSVNVQPGQPNAFCSCCGCCCDVLRTITQFNTPGLIAPPHFRPAINEDTCVQCGECAERCPMGALTTSENGMIYKKERCIGCGICAVACSVKAVTMEAVDDYSDPPGSYFTLGLRMMPGYIKYTLFD